MTIAQVMKSALPAITPARFQPRGTRSALSPIARGERGEVANNLPAEAPSACTSARCRLLEAVPGPRRLGGRSGRGDLGGIVVEPVDIRVGVVGDVVLTRQAYSEAEERIRLTSRPGGCSGAAKVRATVRVVLTQKAIRIEPRTSPRRHSGATIRSGEENRTTQDATVTRERPAPSGTADRALDRVRASRDTARPRAACPG